jgi:hypothetical protein
VIFFVADAFVEQYVGGAELTTQAIIEGSLHPSARIITSNVSIQLMQETKDCFWIFGNFANLSNDCMLYAVKNLKYSVLEYDYKYCSYRSPEKHAIAEGLCDCSMKPRGKLTALFLKHAQINWWMSEGQKSAYQEKYPFLEGKVLSSVFSDSTLDLIDDLYTDKKNDTWLILNSKSWIKGVDEAVDYAKAKDLKYELVWGLEYQELLKKMAKSKGLIFFPRAGDTCPRMVIEAKLLGCELILNENVQHKDEEWFATKNSCKRYMRARSDVFWAELEEKIHFLPNTVSKTGPKYHIISPFYNAEPFLSRCISSLKRQKYDNFNCILVDDVSTDNSYDVAKQAISGDNRFKLIKNDEKRYALKNISDAINASDADDDDVIILLDGDDWFASGLTLGHLNTHYEDNECWMTYGSYVMHPYGVKGPEPSAYPQDIIDNNTYRKDAWRASHLRTFRKKIWDKVNKKDFQDADGNFYKMAYDQAIMLPLIEMSGDKCKYLEDILHVYNKENPLNVDKIKAQEQAATAKEIRAKKSYERIQ